MGMMDPMMGGPVDPRVMGMMGGGPPPGMMRPGDPYGAVMGGPGGHHGWSPSWLGQQTPEEAMARRELERRHEAE